MYFLRCALVGLALSIAITAECIAENRGTFISVLIGIATFLITTLLMYRRISLDAENPSEEDLRIVKRMSTEGFVANMIITDAMIAFVLIGAIFYAIEPVDKITLTTDELLIVALIVVGIVTISFICHTITYKLKGENY